MDQVSILPPGGRAWPRNRFGRHWPRAWPAGRQPVQFLSPASEHVSQPGFLSAEESRVTPRPSDRKNHNRCSFRPPAGQQRTGSGPDSLPHPGCALPPAKPRKGPKKDGKKGFVSTRALKKGGSEEGERPAAGKRPPDRDFLEIVRKNRLRPESGPWILLT